MQSSFDPELSAAYVRFSAEQTDLHRECRRTIFEVMSFSLIFQDGMAPHLSLCSATLEVASMMTTEETSHCCAETLAKKAREAAIFHTLDSKTELVGRLDHF